jgi:exodeoxyribonuclease III
MKIATWNINGVNRRLPLLVEWLTTAKPDIVALQELKCVDDDFPRGALEAAGYGSLCVGQKTWNGVALLARDAQPIEVRRALPGDVADRQARYLEAAIEGVLVASIYLPNGNPSRARSTTTNVRGSTAWSRTRRRSSRAVCRWR